MHFQSPLLLLSSVLVCYAQDPPATVDKIQPEEPPSGTTEKVTGDAPVPAAPVVAAVVPTEPGQIGINPVDIPPPEHYGVSIGVDTQYLTIVQSTTSWIPGDPAFGTATLTTTDDQGQPQETTIPDGFLVLLNEEENLMDITISKSLKEEIAEIAAELPSCSISKVKRSIRHHQKRQADLMCVRQRTSALAKILRERPSTLQQLGALRDDIAFATGNDVAALKAEGKMISFGGPENTLTDIISVSGVAADGDAAALLAGVGTTVLGVVASLAFMLGANDSSDVWKIKAEPKIMPIVAVDAGNSNPGNGGDEERCPEELACAGTRCVGKGGKCTAEWESCPCVISGETSTENFFLSIEELEIMYDEIAQFVFGSDPEGEEQDIPQPECGPTEEGSNTVNVETGVWGQLLDALCEGKGGLSGNIEQTMRTSDISVSSYADWTFDFSFDTSRENDCTAYSCVDVFGKFTRCTYTSHDKYKSGQIKLDCGTARYEIHEPVAEEEEGGDDSGDQEEPTGPSYDAVAFSGISTNKDDWEVVHYGNQNLDICSAAPNEGACPACRTGEVTMIPGSDGCSGLADGNPCENCRPWELACFSAGRCDGKSWDECTRCRAQ